LVFGGTHLVSPQDHWLSPAFFSTVPRIAALCDDIGNRRRIATTLRKQRSACTRENHQHYGWAFVARLCVPVQWPAGQIQRWLDCIRTSMAPGASPVAAPSVPRPRLGRTGRVGRLPAPAQGLVEGGELLQLFGPRLDAEALGGAQGSLRLQERSEIVLSRQVPAFGNVDRFRCGCESFFARCLAENRGRVSVHG